MKKVISLKPYNSPVFYKDNIFQINNGHNAFYGLDKFLSQKKISVQTSDVVKHPDIYLYADMPYLWRIDLWIKLILTRSKHHVLFVLESPLINPFNHFDLLQDFFDKVYTWSPEVQTERISQLFIPQLESKKISEVPFEKKKLLVLINAHKVLPLGLRLFSLSKKNLYEERIKAIKILQRILPFNFDVYGKGWEGFSANKGQIQENKKLEILSRYKFCLCFENTQSNGYLTEKIFDCFKAKVVPIYFGAPDIDTYIPKDTFIDMRIFPSYTELLEFLLSMSKSEYELMIKKADEFLKSSMYKKWSQTEFFNKILKEAQHV